MTINEIQDEIIEEFEILGDDRETTIIYIMELGQKLAPLPEADYQDQNLIKGCQSSVWLTALLEEGKVIYKTDSNTDVTKGLISLLVRILSNQSPQNILDADLYFIEKIGMSNVIGSQRSNGFANMIKQVKVYALAFQTQLS